VQRSWGTVEPAAWRAGRHVIGTDGQRFARNGYSRNRDDRGQEARKTGVQGAAPIRRISAARRAVVDAALRVMMMVRWRIHVERIRLWRSGRCHRQRIRTRRRRHTRELGDQEQADQHTGEPGYRPQQLHVRGFSPSSSRG